MSNSKTSDLVRCHWAKSKEYIKHHDSFWGKLNQNENVLFKYLCLEGQAAGLSFDLILSKTKAYEKLFFNFDPYKIIKLKPEKINSYLKNTEIIRYEKKLNAIVDNAKAWIELKQNKLSLVNLIYGDNPKIFVQKRNETLITRNDFSDELSKKLKKLNFKFIGSVTIFSYLQAIGYYNDHEPNCFLYKGR